MKQIRVRSDASSERKSSRVFVLKLPRFGNWHNSSAVGGTIWSNQLTVQGSMKRIKKDFTF